MKIHNLLTAGLLLGATAAAGQSMISVEPIDCMAMADNQVIRATVTGERAGETARLYFRWKERGSFYWVDMQREGPGRLWGIPPKPEKRNETVEYYAALLDATGRETARSMPKMAPVKENCKVNLTPVEEGVANNLTVGETAATQEGKEVLGFLCEGIVTRVNAQGIRRADEACRACVVAWWMKRSVVLPAVAGVTGIIITDDDDGGGGEVSPSRP